jgi:hypothetical protein
MEKMSNLSEANNNSDVNNKRDNLAKKIRNAGLAALVAGAAFLPSKVEAQNNQTKDSIKIENISPEDLKVAYSYYLVSKEAPLGVVDHKKFFDTAHFDFSDMSYYHQQQFENIFINACKEVAITPSDYAMEVYEVQQNNYGRKLSDVQESLKIPDLTAEQVIARIVVLTQSQIEGTDDGFKTARATNYIGFFKGEAIYLKLEENDKWHVLVTHSKGVLLTKGLYVFGKM